MTRDCVGLANNVLLQTSPPECPGNNRTSLAGVADTAWRNNSRARLGSLGTCLLLLFLRHDTLTALGCQKHVVSRGAVATTALTQNEA